MLLNFNLYILLFTFSVFGHPILSHSDEVHDFVLTLNEDHFEGFDINNSKALKHANKYLKSKIKSFPPVKSFPILESEKVLEKGEIPQYVLDYTPLVHLYTEEKYLPYDVEDFVKHFHLEYKNGTKISNSSLTLESLGEFATNNTDFDTSPLFLSCDDAFEGDPDWLTGKKNIPSLNTGKIKDAPAVLIVVDKGNGWVDAYWFYFYSFNLGPFVMGHGPYGNHIGDWEHSLTRFYKGVPIFVWMSAHGGGGSYYYSALEKSDIDDRKPIIFSARGTHANYPSTGQHPHDLPFGILSDFANRGALWDPSKNYLGYTWDGSSISPVSNSSKADNSRELRNSKWLMFKGHWGDDKLAPDDPRQRWSPWEWKYIEGPTGPLTKHLSRVALCQRSKWWNFSKSCPAKKFIALGNGYEKEEGIVCANVFGWVKPRLLRKILNNITWGGGLCYVLNWVYG